MWDGFAQLNLGEVIQTWVGSSHINFHATEETLFSAGAAESDVFLSGPVPLAVFGPEPLRDLLRIESYRSTHAKTRKLSARGHAVNVLIAYSQYGRKVRNLDATTPRFQLFNQIEFHAILQAIAIFLTCLKSKGGNAKRLPALMLALGTLAR